MKYIDAELLRKEVKRLEKAAHKSALGCTDSETRKFYEGKDFAYQCIGIHIDSLQQEQPDVDLEKEIIDWAGKFNPSIREEIKSTAYHFANCQKEQMLKDAVEGEILLTPYPTIALDDCKDYDFKDGQKVRTIILPKED